MGTGPEKAALSLARGEADGAAAPRQPVAVAKMIALGGTGALVELGRFLRTGLAAHTACRPVEDELDAVRPGLRGLAILDRLVIAEHHPADEAPEADEVPEDGANEKAQQTP